MKTDLVPFNLDLLLLRDADIRNVPTIEVMDIFDGFSKNFHPKGLFSTEYFGRVGEEKRNRMFGNIDMHIDVFHPVEFKAICDLKELYGQIMAGKAFAVFNPKTRDFDKVAAGDGETGFAFFMKHYEDLVFEERPSTKREFAIQFVNKYRKNPTFNRLIVLPAGLRDYTVDETGKPSEDEINGLYRKVLQAAQVIQNVNVNVNKSYLDQTRYAIQTYVNEIYAYIMNGLDGKSKLVSGSWASRKTFHSTRNVITSFVPESYDIDSPKRVSCNQTVVSLYQYLRMILPLAVNRVRDKYMGNVFTGPNSPMMMVNKKTLKREQVPADPDLYDSWMTYEGLEKTFASFGEDHLRHQPLATKDHYVALIYLKDDVVKVVYDIDDLPEGYDRKAVSPITFAQVLYLSVYEGSDGIPTFVTRYPITGYGSIYPSYVYLKTTVKSEIRYELDESWEKKTKPMPEFPITGGQFYNSMSPHFSHLKRLTADFDGDMMSSQAVLSIEAIEEIQQKLLSRNYYVGVTGEMIFSMETDIVKLTLSSMTG